MYKPFYDTYSTSVGSSPLIAIHVPAGKLGDYQSAWGISQTSFTAGENTAIFGEDHNAISIVDDAP
jgi:hypothetical protein